MFKNVFKKLIPCTLVLACALQVTTPVIAKEQPGFLSKTWTVVKKTAAAAALTCVVASEYELTKKTLETLQLVLNPDLGFFYTAKPSAQELMALMGNTIMSHALCIYFIKQLGSYILEPQHKK